MCTTYECEVYPACPKVRRLNGHGNGTTIGGSRSGGRCPPGAKCLPPSNKPIF